MGLFTISTAKMRHMAIGYEAIVSILLFFCLGLLLRYHAFIITNGETCIERLVNKQNRDLYRRRYKNLCYKNPYDFGPWENWKQFLGFDRNRNPWRHILLPSSFPPIGDGFTWTINDYELKNHDKKVRLQFNNYILIVLYIFRYENSLTIDNAKILIFLSNF